MRIFTPVLFFLCLVAQIHAQDTIIRMAPNDTSQLSATKIVDVAVVKGQQSTPINLAKPVLKNLLHWRYYDDISKENVVTDIEPVWTKGTQLLEDIPATEMFSLHINLVTTDSLHPAYKIYLVLSGVTKQALAAMPAEASFDTDIYTPMRFAAIAQITKADGSKETYDSMGGTCTLDSFNPKTGALKGTFQFTGNRIGLQKKRYFLNGMFMR